MTVSSQLVVAGQCRTPAQVSGSDDLTDLVDAKLLLPEDTATRGSRQHCSREADAMNHTWGSCKDKVEL